MPAITPRSTKVSKAARAAPPPAISDFQAHRAQSAEALRAGLLDAAGHILVTEGVSALSVRKVASRINCSTTVVYTTFGGKDGMVEELYLEGFSRFAAALAKRKKPADPVEDALSVCRVYRESALRNPDYYGVMYGAAVPGFRPSKESRRTAWGTLKPLIDALDAGMQNRQLRKADPVHAARMIWSAMHGVVALELTGYLLGDEKPEKLFEDVVLACINQLKG
jgi:AcrR family transcriptional regulator